MKKGFKKLLCVVLAAITCGSVLVGCGGGGAGSKTVKFLYKGSVEQVDMYTRMVDAFNAGYGKEHGIKVQCIDATANYETIIETKASDELTDPFDVFLVADAEFKQYILKGYCSSIQEELDKVTDVDLGDIMPSTTDRLRYNIQTNTSNDGDPYYGLPLDTMPTALYYNESLFEKAGIVTISVDEEDLEAWNNDEIPDNRGKYKRDYAAIGNKKIPAKGFYRSINPYTASGTFKKAWVNKEHGELLVFNNRIAMNWDEVEDLAMFFSGVTNPADGEQKKTEPTSVYGSKYGYFTEWWFNYGWSVGGDCLQDMTGEGEWNFSLLDPNPNYIVKEGKTYVGRISGKTYQAGETIEFTDKMDITAGEVLEADNSGGYKHANGAEATIAADVKAAATGDDAVLSALPSTRDAFVRYLLLGTSHPSYPQTDGGKTDVLGKSGLGISMYPNSFSGANTLLNNFYTGNLAIMANTSLVMADVATNMDAVGRKQKWDVAPLVVYKQYADPTDPDCDTVVARGKDAGHSNTMTMLVRAKSQKKDIAATFIKWMSGLEAQGIRASLGYFPTQASLIDDIDYGKLSYAPSNIVCFGEAIQYQQPGDWWYMPDHLWVEQWCVELNSYVRTGKRSYTDWINGTYYDKSSITYPDTANMPVVQRTNLYLKQEFNDKNYSR